jgi:hypothetical protein
MSHRGWAPITRRVAVTVDGESLDVADLVVLGVLTGDWPEFQDEVARGLGLERAHPDGVGAEEVRAEATAFRYAHGLISAADFRAWLEARELTVGELSDVLRRRLLRRDGRAGSEWCGPPASDEDVVGVLAAEAFCDGVLARLAERGVQWLAAGRLAAPGARVARAGDDRVDARLPSVLRVRDTVLDAFPTAEMRERLSRLLALELSLERLRRDVAEPGALARRMRQHALEWTELAGDELRFTREGAAREARLQLTADGESVATVAERADVPVLDRRLLVGEAPEAHGVSFAAAAVGEVVGPWVQDGRWHVMQVHAKVPPSVENQSLRDRAAEELLAERVGRYTAGRVTRHAQL